MLIKSYKFRIYPTRKQTTILNTSLEKCRWLYNHFLEQKKKAWDENKQSISAYQQMSLIPQLKETTPSLKQVYSQCLQDVPYRLELAFAAFFRRVKQGLKPGYPRFKGLGQYTGLRYPQVGPKDGGFLIINNKLKLSKIGYVKIKMHRPLQGSMKTCTITRTSTGKWFASIVCNCPSSKQFSKTTQHTGIDVGIKHFITLSDSAQIANPRFFAHEEKALVKAQRKFSKCKNGSFQRCKSRKVVSKIHERIKNKRNNFTHQLSRKLVNTFQIICFEDLNVNKMVKDRIFGKLLHDAAWTDFLTKLTYKAEWAGRQVVKVNPAYTSQDCSTCGYRQLMPLENRVYKCPDCGLVLDRDHNAALNILRLGTQSLGLLKPLKALAT